MGRSDLCTLQIVIVGDDCALPPPRGIAGRRGLAGTILVLKVLTLSDCWVCAFTYEYSCTYFVCLFQYINIYKSHWGLTQWSRVCLCLCLCVCMYICSHKCMIDFSSMTTTIIEKWGKSCHHCKILCIILWAKLHSKCSCPSGRTPSLLI